MNTEQLMQLIKTSTEGQFHERKSARKSPDDVVRHLVAFANASGGDLVIGVEDDGTISGFDYPGAKKVEDFTLAAHRLLRHMPVFYHSEVIPVQNRDGNPDEVLVFHIPTFPGQVITSFDGEAYLRSGDQTLKLTYEQRQSLEYDRGQRFFEDEAVPGSSISDVDEDVLWQYKLAMGVEDSSDQDVLEARNLLKNGQLTNAGVVLFAKRPTKYLPSARIRFLRYDGVKGETGSDFNVVKELTFEGPASQTLEDVREAVGQQLRDFQYLNPKTGRFEVVREYPEFAWLEGVVNGVTHRDYSFRGDHIRISMFDDRLEIFSPGKLPNIVTLENMINTRYSRNPRIARVLAELGWVKELNEGVKRIYTEMERAFLGRPTYREPNDNSVQLILENNIINRVMRLTDKVEELIRADAFSDLTDDERMLLQAAFLHGRVTVKDGSTFLGRSKRYTSNLLKQLAALQLLKWNGANPNDPMQFYTFNK